MSGSARPAQESFTHTEANAGSGGRNPKEQPDRRVQHGCSMAVQQRLWGQAGEGREHAREEEADTNRDVSLMEPATSLLFIVSNVMVGGSVCNQYVAGLGWEVRHGPTGMIAREGDHVNAATKRENVEASVGTGGRSAPKGAW